ncbi:succinate dehydrogenase assembly factor 2 [Gammaproteobacteria bacterium]|nr:succinate dehydrogenase assembly factor 2 [Gammaproteobacteria bacterium]
MVLNKSRLVWQCRRGTLELDLVLQKGLPYLHDLFDRNPQLVHDFLSLPDPQLNAWLVMKQPAEGRFSEVVFALTVNQVDSD